MRKSTSPCKVYYYTENFNKIKTHSEKVQLKHLNSQAFQVVKNQQ